MGNACSSGKAEVAQERVGGCCSGSSWRGAGTEGITKGSLDAALDLPGVLEILSKVELFKKLPQSEHPALAQICAQQTYSRGQVLIKQGDEGDALYVISKGIVSVKVDGKQVAKMTVGECVGERALLRDEPRAATIAAETPLAVITITRAQFEEGGFKDKLRFVKRQAVGGGDEGDAVVTVEAPTPKSEQDRKQITSALLANSNLNGMFPMTKMQCDAIAEVCWDQDVPAGTEIIKQGDETDNALFYIVRRGEFNVKVTSKVGAIVYTGQIGPGGSFGELALIYSSPRAATISAIVDSSVWCVDRVRYQDIIADTTAKERTQRYLDCIEKATFFDSLQREEKEAVANALTEMEFERDETIFEQGEIGTAFYILYDGEVAVLKNDKQVAALTGNADKATIFGELALLTSEPRAATIQVISEVARAMYMEKHDFDLLLGNVEGGGYGEAAPGRDEQKDGTGGTDNLGDGKVRTTDLEKIGILGCGGFGVVHFVVHKKTNQPYALKSLNKGHIIKCKMKEATMREKKIQMMCDSPFIVKLFDTFNEPQALLFLMEVVVGGELYDLYERNALHGSEPHAKYYVAAVALAFEHMHGKKIIYRDLKPENLLLTEEGKLKLTDMGLAKVVIGKTRTVCGTPDYFAPEMIAREGYTVALDWWTLGILTFELMVGKAPFAGDGNVMVQIKKGIKSVKFPPRTQGPSENLIKGLCETKPTSRLPMKKGGSANIKTHDWFKEFDWHALAAGSLTPPFKPDVKSREAIAEAHWSSEDMPPQLPYSDDGSGWDKDFAST